MSPSRVLLGTLLTAFSSLSAYAKPTYIDVTLKKSVPSVGNQTQINLRVPTDYFVLKDDLVGGETQAISLGVWLTDMSPSGPKKRAVYDQAQGDEKTKFRALVFAGNEYAADVAVHYEPARQDVTIQWDIITQRNIVQSQGYDAALGMEKLSLHTTINTDSTLYRISDISAFAQCWADSKRCKVTTYLADGIYVDIIFSQRYLSDVREIRKRIIALIQTFRSNAEQR